MPTDNNYCGWADGRTDGLVPLSMCRRGGGGARRGKLTASGFSSFSIVTRPRRGGGRGGGRGNQKRYWVLPRRSYQSSSSSSSSSARLTAVFPPQHCCPFCAVSVPLLPAGKSTLRREGRTGEPTHRVQRSAAPPGTANGNELPERERPTSASGPNVGHSKKTNCPPLSFVLVGRSAGWVSKKRFLKGL